MILPFKEEIINDREYSKYNFEHPQFIGYLNKYGEILEYSEPLGYGGHSNNRLTTYFESYFNMPEYDSWIQETEKKNVIDLEYEQHIANKRRKMFKNELEYYSELVKEYGYNDNIDSIFEYDLNTFFYNCYQANTFMEGFGQNCMALNESEFYQQFYINKYKNEDKATKQRLFEYDYHWYKKNLMLDWYKTVIVQYMHYHLIERCEKGITTSNLKPYETFYNYLLNDYTIHQIPIMIYDSNLKKYVEYEQNSLLIPDSELRYKKEIESIRKLVPLNERIKYYR